MQAKTPDELLIKVWQKKLGKTSMIRKNGLLDYANKDKTSFLLLGIGVLVFIKMLILNFLTPLGLDDGLYSGSTSIINAIQQEYERYISYNGRAITGLMVRLVLMLPKRIFNILNSIVFVCFTMLIYKIANPKKQNRIILYLFIIFSIWLFTPVYGQTILWKTDAVNYLWAATIILSFLLPYFSHISDKIVFKNKYIPVIGMLLLGVLAGWCNENTSGGMILIVFLVLIYCKIFKQKAMPWMISGLAGSIIGFLFMLLSPGIHIRAQGFIDERPMLAVFADRISTLTMVIGSTFSILIMVFIVLITMQIMLTKNNKRTFISIAFFVASIASIYAMVLSPYTDNPRPMFGPTIFMIIACAHCLVGISFEKESLKPYKIAVVSFVCILAFQFATSFIIAAEDILLTSVRLNRRANFIQTESSRGNLHVLLPQQFAICTFQFTPWNPRYGFADITHDISHDMNRCYALNFGIESIRWAP